jgi:magnesium transporter
VGRPPQTHIEDIVEVIHGVRSRQFADDPPIQDTGFCSVRRLITISGKYTEPDDRQVASCVKARDREGFWLDIQDPDDSDYRLLLDVFHFHRLTVEDVQLQNSRPKLDQFDSYAFAVVFSATLEKRRLVYQEHHMYLSAHMVVSVHQGAAPPLDALLERIRKEPEITQHDTNMLKYLVVNEVTEAMFSVMDELDDQIDKLEDQIISDPTPRTLSTVYRLKHEVIELRRVLSAQREVFQHMVTHAVQLLGDDAAIYYRDVYDHVLRQYETVDSLRDLLTGATDVYLSTVSNRLNSTMKQLTVIASLFLPLTFLTGFFGMNFGYLVSHIGAPAAFAGGVAIMVATTAFQLILFWRRGYF